jgi:hypothetical protein
MFRFYNHHQGATICALLKQSTNGSFLMMVVETKHVGAF